MEYDGEGIDSEYDEDGEGEDYEAGPEFDEEIDESIEQEMDETLAETLADAIQEETEHINGRNDDEHFQNELRDPGNVESNETISDYTEVLGDFDEELFGERNPELTDEQILEQLREEWERAQEEKHIDEIARQELGLDEEEWYE